MPVKIKRAYEKPARADGKRFLIDALWPRGIKKEDLKIEAWLKELAPSTELRQWFHHDPTKWQEFQRQYRRELRAQKDALASLRQAAQRGTVTLVYSARDEEHNNAIVLQRVLEGK
jgi:uncharacterized protein YeaO (DUF488 family)